ncbi:MAG: DNA mismatch endonuclease Vsr [Acidobacteria bacterium]|nr:DNA mismatch endonuclease Vsr [Acidobacteriota bacterium]
MDRLDPTRRSENMRRIRSKHTKPEMAVRKITHSLGFRYRLHSKHLPGKPDLVFASRRAVIFVHGCFWHLHQACREGRVPSTRRAYWLPKLERNVARDREHITALKRLGWRTLTIWECEIADHAKLGRKIQRFLTTNSSLPLSKSPLPARHPCSRR